jgi:hypothetical protein
MVSPEALKLNEILRNAPKAVDMDLPHQREAGEHAEDRTRGLRALGLYCPPRNGTTNLLMEE